MAKNNRLQVRNRTKRGALVTETAAITGYSERHIRRVLNGDYNNEYIFATYMTLLEEFNKLPDAVRLLVPLDYPGPRL